MLITNGWNIQVQLSVVARRRRFASVEVIPSFLEFVAHYDIVLFAENGLLGKTLVKRENEVVFWIKILIELKHYAAIFLVGSFFLSHF